MFFRKKEPTLEQQAQAHESQVKHDQRVKAVTEGTKRTFKGFMSGKDKVQQSIGEFVGVAKTHQQVDFSPEQYALSQCFGNGKKIWGLPDSTTGVHINRTLFSGTTETGNLFGFGNSNFENEHRTRRFFGF